MRKIWVKIDPYDRDMVTAAIEGGADALLLPPGCAERAKQLGCIPIISEDGDLQPGNDIVEFTLHSGEEEEEVLKLSQHKQVILSCTDWTIIPLENLIAKGANVLAQVNTLDEAELVFGILETGISGIVLAPESVAELSHALTQLRAPQESIELHEAEILEITRIGMGDRVCVDTCTLMERGEGLLTGNSSSALFLIQAESLENPYVAPRPFRVNAGAVHAYTRVPGGKTRYLSELSAGDAILLVNAHGKTTPAIVGRVKIEKRPLLLLKARSQNREFSAILQNAETIRLLKPDGEPVSVVALQQGDIVLVACEEGGRHFGHSIQESIQEQ